MRLKGLGLIFIDVALASLEREPWLIVFLHYRYLKVDDKKVFNGFDIHKSTPPRQILRAVKTADCLIKACVIFYITVNQELSDLRPP